MFVKIILHNALSHYVEQESERAGELPRQLGNKTECALLGFVNTLTSPEDTFLETTAVAASGSPSNAKLATPSTPAAPCGWGWQEMRALVPDTAFHKLYTFNSSRKSMSTVLCLPVPVPGVASELTPPLETCVLAAEKVSASIVGDSSTCTHQNIGPQEVPEAAGPEVVVQTTRETVPMESRLGFRLFTKGASEVILKRYSILYCKLYLNAV